MIFVCLTAVTRFHELMPRDGRHRIQQTLVADAPGTELGLHHVPALDRKTIGMKFGGQRRSRILPMSDLLLTCVVAGDSPAHCRKLHKRM